MPAQFGDFRASELYCGKCQRAQPVRERLLLVLPTGELHEYLCVSCGSSLGERTVTHASPVVPAAPPSAPPPARRQNALQKAGAGIRKLLR